MELLYQLSYFGLLRNLCTVAHFGHFFKLGGAVELLYRADQVAGKVEYEG